MSQAALMERVLQATLLLWVALVVVWVVGALRTKRNIKTQSSASQLLYTVNCGRRVSDLCQTEWDSMA